MEYIHVPHNVYCCKRAEVLQSFLDGIGIVHNDVEDDVEKQEQEEQGGGGGVKDSTTTTSKIKSIFATDVMKEAFEIQTITNIQREIQLLQAGNILSLL